MLREVLERPVSVLIATLALVVIGVFSLLRLPVSLLPTLERPRLLVTVRDAELSREELLQRVVEPLERRFLSLKGVLEVTSTVDDGHCRLVLETEWQTDVDRLRIDAERRLAEVSDLGLDELQIAVEAGDRRPILEIAVLGGITAHERTVFAEEVLIPELGRTNGAGRLRRFGGALARPVVRPHAAALAARGLVVSDVTERLEEVGQSRPTGRLRDGGVVRPMFVRESVSSLDELRALRLHRGNADSGSASLGDVASVELEEVPDTSHFRWNGEDAVLVELHRAPGANAVVLARDARRTLERLEERLEERLHRGLRLEIVRDSSLEVIEALAQLGLAGFLGLGLGTLVMRFMLGSWRPTLALMVVVPASLVTAFGGFYLWDVSLDIVSLAGLALAAGMLVDNSIVVLEAIEGARAREDAVVAGTRQIALALVASFLTTAVVFIPLIYLQGLARAFFGVQAFAIVTALAVSLALSLTLTPVLSRRLGRRTATTADSSHSPGLKIYLALLDPALRRPGLVIVATLVILGGGAALLPTLPRELVPHGPSRVLVVDYRLGAALDPREMAARAAEVEERLRAVAGTPQSAMALYRGRDDDGRVFPDEAERGRVEFVYAEPASLEDARADLRRELDRIPGVHAEIRARRSAVAAALERSQSRVEVEVSATTPRRAEQLAERAADFLHQELGVTVRTVREGGAGNSRPAYVLRWDAFRFAQLGTDPEPVAWQVQAALGGFFAGRVEIDGVEREILVETTLPTAPHLLPVRPGANTVSSGGSRGGNTVSSGGSRGGNTVPSGGSRGGNTVPSGGSRGGNTVVPLGAVATVERRNETPTLERANARPALRLALDGTLDPSTVAAVLAALPRAVDEEVRLVGQAHELERSFVQLKWALILALVLVFLTVAALYESLAMPLVVMITVPVAAAGALGVLRLAGQSLNVMSFLGLILLAGIVVNNAIVLVHRIEQRLDAGLAVATALREAAAERYRPILMTTVTTLLGMIPLAALGGEGIELRRALALAVAGGLVTSLFAALFVVPVLHRALVRNRQAPAEAPLATEAAS